MGEAKRRKAVDPTYGRPKRGLVMSAPLEFQGPTLHVKSTNLDPQELRLALLFWDRLVWPSSRAIHFASGPDEQFLEQAGIMKRPDHTFFGDVTAIARTQIQAFLELDQKEPGLWSFAQGENSLLIDNQLIQDSNGASVELFRAIPVPNKDVPLNDILEFRTKRHDELQALRNEIDTLVASINSAPDKEAELSKRVANVDAACANALRVSKEWNFPLRLSNFKVSVDLRPFNSVAAAIVGWTAGASFGLPAATALLTGVAASLKIGADFGTQRIRPRQGPYP